MSEEVNTLTCDNKEGIAYYEDIDQEFSNQDKSGNKGDGRYEVIDEARMKVSGEMESGTGVKFDMINNKCYGSIQPAHEVEAGVKYLLMIVLTLVTVALLMLGWFLFLIELGFRQDYIMYVAYCTSLRTLA